MVNTIKVVASLKSQSANPIAANPTADPIKQMWQANFLVCVTDRQPEIMSQSATTANTIENIDAVKNEIATMRPICRKRTSVFNAITALLATYYSYFFC